MNAIPLIRGNTPQEINTSIIALKNALAVLEANDKDVQNKIKQINELINGINSHLDTVDGQITDLQPVDTVTSGDTHSVTSNAVADILSALPTDAVLHYSFDEVPDYPDGVADVRLLNNNTYDIQSTNYKFYNNGGTTFSNENGKLKVVIAGGDWTGAYQYASYLQNKIVKLKIKVTDITGTLSIRAGGNILKNITSVGVYDVMEVHPTDTGSNQLYYFCFGTGNSCTFTVEQIYIGDGSYTTPVIDNANGEWNSTSQSGVAIQGVSGKGLKQFANQITRSGFNLNDDFSISIWVNPENNTSARYGDIVSKSNQFILRNGQSDYNALLIWLYGESTTLLNQQSIGSLLTANTWTHLAIVRDGLSLKVYRNGNQTQNLTLDDSTLRKNDNTLRIGNNGNTHPQSYDDLLIFNRALSETEVQALYLNRGNTPKYYSWADWKLSQV